MAPCPVALHSEHELLHGRDAIEMQSPRLIKRGANDTHPPKKIADRYGAIQAAVLASVAIVAYDEVTPRGHRMAPISHGVRAVSRVQIRLIQQRPVDIHPAVAVFDLIAGEPDDALYIPDAGAGRQLVHNNVALPWLVTHPVSPAVHHDVVTGQKRVDHGFRGDSIDSGTQPVQLVEWKEMEESPDHDVVAQIDI